MNIENINALTLLARRWRDKTTGNTYHSARVYINQQLIGEKKIAYGYGDHYQVTALKILQQAGYALDYKMLWEFKEAIGREKYLVDCIDVSRKSDL